MYAIFNGADQVAKFLFPFEFDVYTDLASDMFMPIQTDAGLSSYLISDKVPALFIAVIQDRYELVHWMLEQITTDDKYAQLRGYRDIYQQGILDYMVHRNSPQYL